MTISAKPALMEEEIEHEINYLPERCKLVFQYSRNEDMSNRETAEKLSISQKAVEKYITKAL